MKTRTIAFSSLTRDPTDWVEALLANPDLVLIVTRNRKPFARITRYTEDPLPPKEEWSTSAPGTIGAPSLGQSDLIGTASMYTEIAEE